MTSCSFLLYLLVSDTTSEFEAERVVRWSETGLNNGSAQQHMSIRELAGYMHQHFMQMGSIQKSSDSPRCLIAILSVRGTISIEFKRPVETKMNLRTLSSRLQAA